MSDNPETPEEAGTQTPIDAAWAAARAAADGEDADAAAARFIDVVLTEPLLCPIWEEGEADADGATTARGGAADGVGAGAGDDEFAPKMIEMNGRDTLALFDTETRLAAFVDAPTAFVALPGRVFFTVARDQGAQIALNPEVADSANLFTGETVSAIADLADAAEQDVHLEGGPELMVEAPETPPSALLTALSARLAAARSLVSEAILFGVSYPAENGNRRRQLVLGLCGADGEAAEEMRALCLELGRLGGAVLGEDRTLDVATFAGSEPLLALARKYGVSLMGPEMRGVEAAS